MYTARQWLILEVLCALSGVSFIACVVATYYNPDILNKGLWALLLFAILCNLYMGSALERVCRGELWTRPRLISQAHGSWRKRRGQQPDLRPELADFEAGVARRKLCCTAVLW
jgi:hypothetical protein